MIDPVRFRDMTPGQRNAASDIALLEAQNAELLAALGMAVLPSRYWIMIWIAPKAYVLEYFVHLIK